MDAADDFNSSDIEYGEPVNPFPEAGKASIEALLERAAHYRLESKRQAKEMSFLSPSPKTEYLNYPWYSRFNRIKVEILKVP